MLSALRRCPASLSRSIRLPTTSSSIHNVVSSISGSSTQRCLARPQIALRAFHQTVRWQQQAAAAATATPQDGAGETPHGQITNFQELADLGLVAPTVIRTITDQFGFKTMSEVQSATINEALKGVDIIAQAKTGTGKTLGFLLPVVQNILKTDPHLERRRGGMRALPSDIRAIIISPTRELAEQIAEEARKLCRDTGLIVQAAVGGTQKRSMLQQLQRQGCHILVGTPGRLNDILSDDYSGVKAPNLTAFVMDEADRLLDQGFWQEIESINSFLPDVKDRDRQTFMFSATVPAEVVKLVRRTLKPGFKFVKCVQDDEEPTHARVPQKVVKVAGLENYFPTLLELLQREKKAGGDEKPLKALVYFNTTADVQLATSLMKELGGSAPVPTRFIEGIHSKLTQQQRTKASDNFRRCTSGILLSSDVTARGMDFPNVTHVIQVGLAQSREQYIHRIGRTGRAGKEGQGYLILSPLETGEARSRLRGLPISEDNTLATASIDMSQPAQVPMAVANILTDVSSAMKYVPRGEMVRVYMGQLGAFQYVGNKQKLIDAMNRLSKWGFQMETPPSVNSAMARRLGLSRLQGIVIQDERERGGYGDDRRGGDRFSDRMDDPFSGEERRGGDRGGDRRSGGFGGRGGDRRGGFSGNRGGDRRGGGRGGFGGGDRRGGFGGDRGGDRGDRGGSSRYGGMSRDRDFR